MTLESNALIFLLLRGTIFLGRAEYPNTSVIRRTTIVHNPVYSHEIQNNINLLFIHYITAYRTVYSYVCLYYVP
jgi:hypothetical protein